MRKFVFLFFLFTTITLALEAQNKITFKASAPETVIVGQQFRLTYRVTNASNGTDFRLSSEISDFDVKFGPTHTAGSSSIIVNGNYSSEIYLDNTYVLEATKEGTFTLPEATIKVNNSNYKSNSVTIKVLPPARTLQEQEGRSNSQSSSQLSDNDIFMRMEVSKANVYEQEPLTVTFKIYSAALLSGVEGIKFPEFEGFLVQDIEMARELKATQDSYNGYTYHVYTLRKSLLFPQRSGNITISSGEADIVVRVATNQRVRNIFDDLLGSYRDVKKKIKTSPVNITVKSLPSGKPLGFSGGVGDFKMETSISSNQVKANEAVTLKVRISGTGNIRLVKNPEVEFPNDFDIFDPKVDTNLNPTSDGSTMTGSKTIEYLAIPRYGGDFEIPAIKFSYFDLKSNSYKTITSESYKLHVEKGEGGENGPVVSNFGNKENVRFLGQDIRYLKVKSIHFLSKEEMLFGSFLYIMCYLIPALLFIIFFILYRKQIKENSDLALVRTKKANKTAVRRLKVAGKLLKEDKEEEFYEEVLRALWGYLSDKLSIPQANLTKDNVEIELGKYGVGEELINEFMEILNTCEFARYAPSKASDAMDKLYQQTIDAIGKMENTIKK